MEHKERFEAYVSQIEEKLAEYLPNTCLLQSRLMDAMQYSLFSGGKRIRPVLLLEICRVTGGNVEAALPFACALEMIHTYSLIHDDLPCMDNDSLRRGRPTTHRVFGESCAVLAGDALLTAAFETVMDSDYVKDTPPQTVLAAAHALAWASGVYGMAGGQVLDLEQEESAADLDTLAQIQQLKTGALIDAAARCACILSGADSDVSGAMLSYARCLGLAYQIMDDLLDADDQPVVKKAEREAQTEALGAEASSACGPNDLGTSYSYADYPGPRPEPVTFVKLLGADECRRIVELLSKEAIGFLQSVPDHDFLAWMVQVLAHRKM